MRLTKLSYKTTDWELIDLELDEVNLIVGKNGTGKSKTLNAIAAIIRIINQKADKLDKAQWELTFINNKGERYIYQFETAETVAREEEIVSEYLFSEHLEFIKRGKGGTAIVFNATTGQKEELNPPPNKLVIHTSRDVKRYPFIEEICTWAEESFGCLFANIKYFSKTSQKEYFESDLGDMSIPSLYDVLGEESRKRIIAEFNSIGYDIVKIEPWKFEKSVYLSVDEDGLRRSIFDFQLSQGMLRALYILIYIEYLATQKKPALIAIDDLCEGLDYERATKLGKLIFEKCLATNIQLVATSNDSFLMDVVDIKYWNVLQRKGKTVTAINIKNHPKIFEDFRFTGLSNFDFFSSDFLNQALAS